MGGKSAPAAPDYTAAAEKTAESNAAAVAAQTAANRPNVNTPYGTQTWTQDGDKWTQNINLTPASQAALNSQQTINQGRSDAAQGLLGQATSAFQNPVNYNNLPAAAQSVQAGNLNTSAPSSAFGFGSLNGTSSDYRQKAQDAVDALQQPSLDRARASAQNTLANQGLDPNSEAYKAQMQSVSDAEARAHLAAIQTGQSEANQSFNQDLSSANLQNQNQSTSFNQSAQGQSAQNTSLMQQLQAGISAGGFNNTNRQASLAEQLQARGQPLNELNALLSGQQVSMPTMPSFSLSGNAGGTNYTGAAQNQYSAALDSTNASNAGFGNLLSGATSLGSAFLFSDERLKEKIRTVGYSRSGLRVVSYRYRGLPGRHVGVIAQEVAKVFPEAVVSHPSGYLMVNYAEIH
jgi:hypothetical protein